MIDKIEIKINEYFKDKENVKNLFMEQLDNFKNQIDKEYKPVKYNIGDDVILNKNTLVHGSRIDVDNLQIIKDNGIISNEFYNEYNQDRKKPFVAEFWDIKENISLKDYLNKYAGFTIEFYDFNGELYNSVITSLDNIKNVLKNESNFRDYSIYQNQEQRFLPNDYINGAPTMAFIVQYDDTDKLIKNDIFDVNFNQEILKGILPSWFYDKYFITRNFDRSETGRGKAILIGIPSNMISGILVNRKIESNNEQLEKIKNTFPNRYICNVDGKIIK